MNEGKGGWVGGINTLMQSLYASRVSPAFGHAQHPSAIAVGCGWWLVVVVVSVVCGKWGVGVCGKWVWWWCVVSGCWVVCGVW